MQGTIDLVFVCWGLIGLACIVEVVVFARLHRKNMHYLVEDVLRERAGQSKPSGAVPGEEPHRGREV